MEIELTAALADPAVAAASVLSSQVVFGVTAASGRGAVCGAAVLEFTLRPLPSFAAEGYPTERARIVVMPDLTVHTYALHEPDREFLHRNPWPGRELCLQYPGDVAALRWLPHDGLEPLLTLVHRHLIYEEFWRRSRRWPTEDAPHGTSRFGAYPILTAGLRQQEHRWVRPLPETAAGRLR